MNSVATRKLWGMATLVALFVALCLALPPKLAAEDAPPPVNAGDSGPPGKKAKSLILGDDSTVWDIFLRGGWCMWPILGCSVVGLVFFFERTVELRRRKHAPPGFDKDVVHVVDTRGVDAGLALCLEKQSSLSRVLYAALLRYGTSRQEMESAVQDEGSRLLYDLRRNCRWIAIMANMAPLWGLLGTVLGLIECFDTISGTGGLGKAEALATGVAVALLTTAFGLIVAIPLLTMYHYNKNSADDIVREISERSVDAIVTLDRKARRSIRLIEDIEEHLETQEMAAARTPSPDLDLEMDEQDRAIKSSIATPAPLPVAEGGRQGSSHELRTSSSHAVPGIGRKEGYSPEHRTEKHS